MTIDSADAVELEFFATAEHLVDVRRLVERLGAKTPLSRGELDDFLTSVDEAVANAICHGSPKGGHSLVRVICHVLPRGLLLEVTDHGPGFYASTLSVPMPGPEATGGRGLPLMCALSDSVEVASTQTGTTITLKKIAKG